MVELTVYVFNQLLSDGMEREVIAIQEGTMSEDTICSLINLPKSSTCPPIFLLDLWTKSCPYVNPSRYVLNAMYKTA
jgi:hypothetical protein